MADTGAPPGESLRGGSLAGLLDRQFGLAANGTTIRTEFVAGVTTFLTMVYIVFVNPEILSSAGWGYDVFELTVGSVRIVIEPEPFVARARAEMELDNNF